MHNFVIAGKLGREATQMKSTQAILQLLWEVSHLSDLPKQLMERALNEQLEILTSLTYNRDSLKRVYVMKCVEDIKHASKCALSSVKHLRDICRSYSRNTALAFQKPDKATLGELNREHEIVKLLSKSLKKCHELAAKVALGGGSGGDDNKPALLPTTAFDSGRYTHSESLDLHLDLLKFLLKEGELYLSWSRCEELWSVLVCNDDAIQLDRDKAFEWFQVRNFNYVYRRNNYGSSIEFVMIRFASVISRSRRNTSCSRSATWSSVRTLSPPSSLRASRPTLRALTSRVRR